MKCKYCIVLCRYVAVVDNAVLSLLSFVACRTCVSLLTVASVASKVPPNTQPRLLQEEGFYVGTRPYVASGNLNRMENRLLKESGGGYVTTDEEACVGDLKDNRVRNHFSYR